jgi:hypothetical protein
MPALQQKFTIIIIIISISSSRSRQTAAVWACWQQLVQQLVQCWELDRGCSRKMPALFLTFDIIKAGTLHLLPNLTLPSAFASLASQTATVYVSSHQRQTQLGWLQLYC